ncbi:hypothetical protein ACVWZX_004203 [Deinococcus sp. UYEF24]
MGQDFNDVDSSALTSLFDCTYLIAVEIRLFREVFLRPPTFLPQSDHIPGQLCSQRVAFIEFVSYLSPKTTSFSGSTGQLFVEIKLIGHSVNSVLSMRSSPP